MSLDLTQRCVLMDYADQGLGLVECLLLRFRLSFVAVLMAVSKDKIDVNVNNIFKKN